MKTKILICTHKECELPNNDYGIFFPIFCGASLSNDDIMIQRDDEILDEKCDNISNKNQNYCELSAIYWAWKNIKKLYPSLQFIGLNHYRRYFLPESMCPIYHAKILDMSFLKTYVIEASFIENVFNQYQAIVPRFSFFEHNLKTHYCINYSSIDFNILQKVINEKYPSYERSFHEVFISNRFLAYNMFVLRWDDFCVYCEWLFDILFEVEKRVFIQNYDAHQARIFGFMGEYLFTLWVHHNILNPLYLPVVFFK